MWLFDLAPFEEFSSIPLGPDQRYFNPGLIFIKQLGFTPRTRVASWSGAKNTPDLE